MLFLRYPSLDWLLIELLAQRRAVSAAWLHSQVGVIHRPCTIQAVYKQLRGLQAQGIVIRSKGCFSLSLWWALEFIEVAAKVEASYLGRVDEGELALKRGERKRWSFSNLLRLDDFMMQLILHSHQASGDPVLYQWVPHPWFYFAHREKVRSYYGAYRKKRNRMKFLIGGETFLDRLFLQEQRPSMIEQRALQTPFLNLWNTHKLVVGDLIITSRIDPRTYRRINELFEETESLAGLSLRKVLTLFNSKVRATVSYEHNPKLARALIKKFERVFLIP